MEVAISQAADNATVITLKGRLDTVSTPDFEKAIEPVLKSNMENVIVECSEFDYISSSGLRLFLGLQKTALASGGKLTVKNLRPEIKEIFGMTGFTALFNFE